MKSRLLVLIAALFVAAPAVAQSPHGHQRDPGVSESGGGSGGQAPAPREAAPRSEPRESPPPRPAPAQEAPERRATPRSADNAAPSQPSGQRQRDPGIGTRQAVPRAPVVAPGGGRVYAPRYNYYFYPRHVYPYGYGGYGLGYFYYDPYLWGPAYAPYYYDPYYYGYYGSSGGGSAYYPNTGELRIEVKPNDAEVYVDGYYAGRVDDFDGAFQSLKLEEGPHTIRIVAPGYEPLEFSVRIFSDHKTTYRGELPLRRP